MVQIRLFGSLLLLLSLTTMASAAPPKDTPAVAAVQQFLDARAAGDIGMAYSLLSSESQQTLSVQTISAKRLADSDGPPPDMPARMSKSMLYALVVLFSDMHNRVRWTFHTLGPDPIDPRVVLVRSIPPVSAVVALASTLRLVTVTDSSGAVRIDTLESLRRAAPEDFAKGARVTSQANLKQLSLAIIQYAFDHDNHLPDADKWADEILPYFHREVLFWDPSAPGQPYAYAFNRTLSGAVLDAPTQPSGVVDSVRSGDNSKVAPAASTVLLFESTVGVKNAADTGQSVPKPGRHFGGTDYAFADGHVKWLPDGTAPSFALTGK